MLMKKLVKRRGYIDWQSFLQMRSKVYNPMGIQKVLPLRKFYTEQMFV